MFAALESVRTTGINWQSVGVIVACMTLVMTVVIWVFNRRDVRARQENQLIRTDITNAVDHLSEVLLAKLETKETVAQISVRLARLEGAAGASNISDHT